MSLGTLHCTLLLRWAILQVSAGIDPRLRNSDNATPLHCACSAGQLTVAKCLLKLPAVADDVNLHGAAALGIVA
jgi:ankyrin repeat protein